MYFQIPSIKLVKNFKEINFKSHLNLKDKIIFNSKINKGKI